MPHPVETVCAFDVGSTCFHVNSAGSLSGLTRPRNSPVPPRLRDALHHTGLDRALDPSCVSGSLEEGRKIKQKQASVSSQRLYNACLTWPTYLTSRGLLNVIFFVKVLPSSFAANKIVMFRTLQISVWSWLKTCEGDAPHMHSCLPVCGCALIRESLLSGSGRRRHPRDRAPICRGALAERGLRGGLRRKDVLWDGLRQRRRGGSISGVAVLMRMHGRTKKLQRFWRPSGEANVTRPTHGHRANDKQAWRTMSPTMLKLKRVGENMRGACWKKCADMNNALREAHPILHTHRLRGGLGWGGRLRPRRRRRWRHGAPHHGQHAIPRLWPRAS